MEQIVRFSKTLKASKSAMSSYGKQKPEAIKNIGRLLSSVHSSEALLSCP